MKKACTAAALLVLVLAFFSACASRSNELDRIETYPDGPIDLVVYYRSFDDLLRDSSAIVYVQASGSEMAMICNGELQKPSNQSNDINGLEVPLDSVRVLACYKGDCIPDEMLTVLNWSGPIPSLQKGERYMLFLSSGGIVDAPSVYAITGGFQGQFIERESLFIQQKTKEVRLQNVRPMTLEQLEQRIEAAKKATTPAQSQAP